MKKFLTVILLFVVNCCYSTDYYINYLFDHDRKYYLSENGKVDLGTYYQNRDLLNDNCAIWYLVWYNMMEYYKKGPNDHYVVNNFGGITQPTTFNYQTTRINDWTRDYDGSGTASNGDLDYFFMCKYKSNGVDFDGFYGVGGNISYDGFPNGWVADNYAIVVPTNSYHDRYAYMYEIKYRTNGLINNTFTSTYTPKARRMSDGTVGTPVNGDIIYIRIYILSRAEMIKNAMSSTRGSLSGCNAAHSYTINLPNASSMASSGSSTFYKVTCTPTNGTSTNKTASGTSSRSISFTGLDGVASGSVANTLYVYAYINGSYSLIKTIYDYSVSNPSTDFSMPSYTYSSMSGSATLGKSSGTGKYGESKPFVYTYYY